MMVFVDYHGQKNTLHEFVLKFLKFSNEVFSLISLQRYQYFKLIFNRAFNKQSVFSCRELAENPLK